MRHGKWVAGLILASAAFSQASAQSLPQAQKRNSDWQVVERLPPGLPILVQAGRHWHHCAFDWADEKSLQCSLDRGPRLLPIRVAPFVFSRDAVLRIRLQTSASSAAAGAAIGAGVGAGWGAIANLQGNRGFSALGGGVTLGLIGGLVGEFLPLLHGKPIYERPVP